MRHKYDVKTSEMQIQPVFAVLSELKRCHMIFTLQLLCNVVKKCVEQKLIVVSNFYEPIRHRPFDCQPIRLFVRFRLPQCSCNTAIAPQVCAIWNIIESTDEILCFLDACSFTKPSSQ